LEWWSFAVGDDVDGVPEMFQEDLNFYCPRSKASNIADAKSTGIPELEIPRRGW